MKKLKKLLPGIISLVMASFLAFAVACSGSCSSCGGDEEEENPKNTDTLVSISVDASGAKTEYLTGESYTSDGLVVTATYEKEDSTTVDKDIAISDVSIDTSAFNNEKRGTYSIEVSYTDGSVTASDAYDVSVDKPGKGLQVTWKSSFVEEGKNLVYTLSKTLTTVDLSDLKNQIEVRKVDAKKNVIDELITGYTAVLYKGQVNVEEVEDITKVGGGAYNLWVEYTDADGVLHDGAILIYVNNNVQKLEFNKDGSTVVTTQEASIADDKISSTWTFTATYADGSTKELGVKDVTMEKRINTSIASTSSKDVGKVTYTEKNATGDAITVDMDNTIYYTITEKKNRTPVDTDNYAFSFQQLTKDVGNRLGSEEVPDQTQLKADDFAGDNVFMFYTAVGSARDYYRTGSNGFVELRDGYFTIVVYGTATVNITIASTGNNDTNISEMAIRNSSNTNVAAKNYGTATPKSGNSYEVAKTTQVTIEYELNAGVYTIHSLNSSRGFRLHALTVADTY